MEYKIEVESGQYDKPAGKEKIELQYSGWRKFKVDCPYLAFSFGGANPGRWRVMAKNTKGEGDWSEWRYFRFEK